MIELFRPEKARVCLTYDRTLRGRGRRSDASGVKLIGLADPFCERGVERRPERVRGSIARGGKTETNRGTLARRELQAIVERRLRARARRVHAVVTPVNDVLVKRILHVS